MSESVIVYEGYGYGSAAAYLKAHKDSLAALEALKANPFCRNPAGNHNPTMGKEARAFFASLKRPKDATKRRPGRPRKVSAPSVPSIPVAVHTVAATFERLGRERGIPEHHMPLWIEAACRVAMRACTQTTVTA